MQMRRQGGSLPLVRNWPALEVLHLLFKKLGEMNNFTGLLEVEGVSKNLKSTCREFGLF